MKKIFSALICAIMCTLLTFSFATFASNHEFDSITLMPGGGWKTVPDGNTKSDNEQNAYVTISSKSGAALVYARVVKASNKEVCTNEQVISKTGKYKLAYKKKVNKGVQMKLQFQATTQVDTVRGKWCS